MTVYNAGRAGVGLLRTGQIGAAAGRFTAALRSSPLVRRTMGALGAYATFEGGSELFEAIAEGSIEDLAPGEMLELVSWMVEASTGDDEEAEAAAAAIGALTGAGVDVYGVHAQATGTPAPTGSYAASAQHVANTARAIRGLSLGGVSPSEIPEFIAAILFFTSMVQETGGVEAIGTMVGAYTGQNTVRMY